MTLHKLEWSLDYQCVGTALRSALERVEERLEGTQGSVGTHHCWGPGKRPRRPPLGEGIGNNNGIPEASMTFPTREGSQVVPNAVHVPRGVAHGPGHTQLIT